MASNYECAKAKKNSLNFEAFLEGGPSPVSLRKELWRRRPHRVVHVDFLLGLFDAELAGPEKNEQRLVVRARLDVGLFRQPLPDRLQVVRPALRILAQHPPRVLLQLGRDLANFRRLAPHDLGCKIENRAG